MMDLIKSISKNEWRFVFWLVLAMLLITGLPYLYGYLSAPPGFVYTGLHALSPGDIPIYYSYINQVSQGELLVKNLFTTEPQTLGTFNVWWVLVGGLAKFFNLSIILVFQLVRLITIPIFIFFAYLFIAYFFSNPLQRKVALVFLLFSSGIGVYFASSIDLIDLQGTLSYWWPIDLWLTESNTFNALYQTSHFVASITLTLLIFLLMFLAFERSKLSYAVWAGVLSLAYFNFHPYYFPVIFGVLGLYLLLLIFQAQRLLWRQISYLALVFLISLPSVIYHIYLIFNSSVIAQRALQNVTLISPPIFIFLGYGFLWLGFGLGLLFLVKKQALNNKFVFLLFWLGVNVALIYSPFPFHSRYTQGLHIILVLFTVAGLFYCFDWLKQKLNPKVFDFWVNNPVLLGLLFLILFSPSTLYSVLRDIYFFSVQTEGVKTKLYLPQGVLEAIDWLGQQPPGQVVLAADIPSKFTPGFSGQTVYLAHAHETLFFDAKTSYALLFFADNKNEQIKINFLNDEKIDYILYSDYEKALGSFNPSTKDYLKLVFDSAQAQVYQVIR